MAISIGGLPIKCDHDMVLYSICKRRKIGNQTYYIYTPKSVVNDAVLSESNTSLSFWLGAPDEH